MTDGPYLKTSCAKCGNHIEYPAPAGGTEIGCPHCGETVTLPEARVAPAGKAKGVLLAILAILFVVAAAAFFVWHQREVATRIVALKQPVAEAANPTHAANATNPLVAVMDRAAAANLTAPATNAEPEAPRPKMKKPKSIRDLSVGKITLDKMAGSRLVHAVGVVRNDSDYQHFGIRVTLDLFDAQGMKIGTAQDYMGIIEPHKNWSFRAMVVEPKAVEAALASIKEESE